MQAEHSKAEGVINNKIQTKHTKAKDTRLHWISNNETQEQPFFLRLGVQILLITGENIIEQHITEMCMQSF